MATVGQIQGVIKLKGGNQFVKEFKTASGHIRNSIKKIKGDFLSIGLQSTAIIYAVNKVVNVFAGLDKNVREIGTLLGNITKDQISKLKENVVKMSIDFGQSFSAMAKARYDIISAGFTKIAESAKVLQVAARLAIGGVSEVNKTALTVTKLLNAFGLSGKYATNVADMLFTTVQKGQTTIDELVATLGQIAPVARAAGLNMDQLGASLAVTTAGGQETQDAGVGLRGAYMALTAPVKAAKQAMDENNISVYRLKDGTMDLIKTFKQFEGMDIAEISRYIPDVRAATAVITMSNNIDKLKDALGAMGKKAGASQKAFAKMAEGIDFRIKQAKQRFQAAMAEIGEALYPLYNLGLTFLELLTKLPKPIKTIMVNAVALAGALKVLSLVLSSFGLAMGPVGWIVTGLSLAAAAFFTFKTQTKSATKELGKFNDEAKQTFIGPLEDLSIDELVKKRAAGLKSINMLEKLKNWEAVKYLKLQDKALLNLIRTKRAVRDSLKMFKDMPLEELIIKRKEMLKGLKSAEESGTAATVRRYGGAVTALTRLIEQKKKKTIQSATEEMDSHKKVVDYQYEYGEISLKQYIEHLRKRQQAFQKNSEEYIDLEYRIKELNEKKITEERNYNQTKQDLEYRYQEISIDEYLRHLEERRDAFRKHSTEYLELDYQIKDIKRQSDQDAFENEKRLMQERFQNNEIPLEEYYNFLNERLAGLKEHSAEYKSVWQEMNQLILQDQKITFNKMRTEWRGYTSIMRGIAEDVGSILTDKMMTSKKKWNEVGRLMLLGIVDVLAVKLRAAYLSALIDQIINFASFMKNAPLIAAAELGIAALKGTIMAMAEGGVITQPTLALVGERVVGGQFVPEVVAPQDKFEDFARRLVLETTGGGSSTSNRQELNVIQNFNTPLQDKRMAQKMTDEVLKPQMRRSMKRQGRFVNRDPFA